MGGWVSLAFWAWSSRVDPRFAFSLPKILVVSVGLAVVAYRRPRVEVPVPALVCLALALVSSILGVWPGLSFEGMRGEWSHGLWALILYVCLMGLPGKTRWLTWAGAGLGLHAVLQVLRHAPWLPGGRAVAWVGSPVDLGAILAMSLPGAGWLSLPIILGLWATGSRAAWVAAAAGVLPWKGRHWLWVPFMVLTLWSSQPKDVARVEVWKSAGRIAASAPWFGTGPDTFGVIFSRNRPKAFDQAMGGPGHTQNHAHNDLLEVASCGGFYGLAAYLALVLPMLAVPGLAALWINLKFNPVSFEVLCTTAVLMANVPTWRMDLRKTAIAVGVLSALYALLLMSIKLGAFQSFV